MRRIEEIAKEDWFHSKPWLILGTGESLERYTPEMQDKYNLWVLYTAFDVTKYADVFHYQDIYCNYYEGRFPTNYRYCAIRKAVAYYFIPEKPVDIVYDGDLTGLPDPFPLSNSTSFAFLFLARNQVKDIYTLGIDDGSKGMCKLIDARYREESVNNDWRKENGTNQHWCDLYKSNWIRL